MAERPALVSRIIAGLRAADPGTFRVLAGGLIYETEESAARTEIIGYGPSPSGGQMPFYTLTLMTAGPRVRKKMIGQKRKDFYPVWVTACAAAAQATGNPKLATLLKHDLRRSGVRNLVRAGVAEDVAMKFSGHRDRTVFSRYNITSDEDKADAVEKLTRFRAGAR